MGDTVRPDDKTFKENYEIGYRTWRHLCLEAAASRECPFDFVDFSEVLSSHHPCIHDGLELKPGDTVHATGTSTWNTAWPWRQPESDLPPIEQPYSIPVTARHPIPVTLGRSPEQFPTWFGARGNHVCILTLAWACALSSHWTEMMPGGDAIAQLEFTESSAVWRQPDEADEGRDGTEMVVDLGPVAGLAIRWWSAVLAPGRGWTVGLWHGDDFHLAPWSTHLDDSAGRFVLTGTFPRPPQHRPQRLSSSFMAMGFISKYATYHGVQSQSRAAFAAALMLPTATRMMGTVTLPAPRLLAVDSERYCTHMTQPELVPIWGFDHLQLAKLVTLSCATTLPSVMKSVFFHPSMDCTEYGAWLQGILAALDRDDVKSDPEVLVGALMAESERVAFLWLGAALLDVHKLVLDDLRGTNPSLDVDLTLAGWFGKTASFIQRPLLGRWPKPATTAPPDGPETITRSTEGMLLFLTRAENYTHPPATPCEPLGIIPLMDCPPEVRRHVHCGRQHMLHYAGWTWDCKDGPPPLPRRVPPRVRSYEPLRRERKIMRQEDYEKSEVDYTAVWTARRMRRGN